MLNDLHDGYRLTEDKASQIAPLTLAYIGDSVFDLYVRTKYALNSQKNAGKLHSMSIRIVNARAQAAFAHEWMERFTDAEKEVFMRGRNAKSPTVPKNMSVADYKYATAMEAVIGYLYLSGQMERANEILGTLEFEL
ncbi:MAG: ribonuclease III domain-containing protein [Christensenella sp.]|uniref:Mini-ribonuclease 3 n=1 Tax=Christensenella sp. TaxID=1935934 RepID=UPI002B20A12D|nr:ribonuclease III domain-containing protein [Christensenella sp.]MEA5003417.1 ribonuclease III domain-containing protein [Christensenella sp.]